MRVLSFRDICMSKLAPLELPVRPEIALQGYSESVTDWWPGLFHWPWDTYYTLREPFKQLNWLDQPSTSKQYFPALGWLNSWIEDKFSQHIFFNFDLEFKKLWWSSKQKFERQLHVSTRNTLPSTASHKDQYSRHWSIISKDSFTTLSLFHEALSNLIAA